MKRHLGVVGVAYVLGVGTMLLLVANTDSKKGKPSEIAALSATDTCDPVQKTNTCESGQCVFSSTIVNCGGASCTGYGTLESGVVYDIINHGRPIFESAINGIVRLDSLSDKKVIPFDFNVEANPIQAGTSGRPDAFSANAPIVSTNQPAFVITSDVVNHASGPLNRLIQPNGTIINFSNSTINMGWHSGTSEGAPITAKVFSDGTIGYTNVLLNYSVYTIGDSVSTNSPTDPADSRNFGVFLHVSPPNGITLCGGNATVTGFDLMPTTNNEAPESAYEWNILSLIGIESGTVLTTDSPSFHSQPLDLGNPEFRTWGQLITRGLENLGFDRRVLSPVPTPDDDIVILGNPTAVIFEEAPTAGGAPEKSGVDRSSSAGPDEKE